MVEPLTCMNIILLCHPA